MQTAGQHTYTHAPYDDVLILPVCVYAVSVQAERNAEREELEYLRDELYRCPSAGRQASLYCVCSLVGWCVCVREEREALDRAKDEAALKKAIEDRFQMMKAFEQQVGHTNTRT